ncbi:MAG: hypothetical protein NTZ67_04215 [Gammaproteobacteria bacterium]|nr:hypothetical protein [Gammaproteobacteria bacterium]
MKKTAALLVTLTTLSTVSFGLTLHSMKKAQVIKAFVNNTATTIPTASLDGKMIQNIISVFLDKKGNIFGRMESKPENEPQSDQGTYIIKNNGTLEITWQHWDNNKTLHAHFFNTKNAYITIDNDTVFHTVFMKAQIQAGNHLK